MGPSISEATVAAQFRNMFEHYLFSFLFASRTDFYKFGHRFFEVFLSLLLTVFLKFYIFFLKRVKVFSSGLVGGWSL